MNLCFVSKKLYILKLIDIYFFTYVVFENMKRNKTKTKISYYIYKCYNYYRYFLFIIYMSFVRKIKRKRK